jgi:hypothetical protein
VCGKQAASIATEGGAGRITRPERLALRGGTYSGAGTSPLGRTPWAYGLLGHLTRGHQATWVDYGNDARTPLLFISGGADHLMPPSMNQSNAKHYAKSKAVTDYRESSLDASITPAGATVGAGRRLRP